MKTKRILIVFFIIIFGLMTLACAFLGRDIESASDIPDQQNQITELVTLEPTIEVVQPTPTVEEPSATIATMRHMFKELGISLDIPKDLYVKKEPLVKYDDQSKLDSYLFYIQNYGYPGGPSSGNFQMYGILQFNLHTISWDEFSNIHINSPNNSYANYIEVGGLRGYDTQLSGVRNRFFYHFYLEGYDLSIAVSDPTPENKILADQIIQSLVFTPGEFTDSSHVKLVSDSNQLFQIFIPDYWDYTFQPTIGMQLSSLEATSPDLDVMVEDAEGPHSNIYYKKGIFLHVQVINDDSEELILKWPNQREYGVYFNGIQGTVYVYVEPSTVEGEIRTVIVYYEGKSYLLRFGYADDADRDTIDYIISNFNITPDTFFPLK